MPTGSRSIFPSVGRRRSRDSIERFWHPRLAEVTTSTTPRSESTGSPKATGMAGRSHLFHTPTESTASHVFSIIAAKMAVALRAHLAALVADRRNAGEFRSGRWGLTECWRIPLRALGTDGILADFATGLSPDGILANSATVFLGKPLHFELTDANGIVALEGLLWPPVGWLGDFLLRHENESFGTRKF